jgi:hypothetical protein
MTTNIEEQRPTPVAFTTEEGGDWVSWGNRSNHRSACVTGIVGHSILFSNGSVFDMQNGWRVRLTCPYCKGSGALP